VKILKNVNHLSEPSHVDKLSKKERKRLKKEKKAAKALAEQQKTNESNNSAIVDSSSPKNKKSKKDKKNKKSNSASSSNTNSKDKSPSKKSKKSSSKSEEVDDNSPFIEYKPASAEKTYPRWNSFDQLKSAIPDWLIKGSCGEFEKPSNVQSTTWPLAFVNKDVIGVARTGSGKTLSFSLPALKICLESKPNNAYQPQVVMLAPTRELAAQIHKVVEAAVNSAPAGQQRNRVQSVCVYGGVPKAPQLKALKTASLVVATPGRLLDLAQDDYNQLDLSCVRMFVLDEADRMLDMGFDREVRGIAALIHGAVVKGGKGKRADVQTLMYSATWPDAIRKLARDYLKDDVVRISIGTTSADDDENGADRGPRANRSVTQHVRVLDNPRDKQKLLVELLNRVAKDGRVIVFCLYKKEAARVEQMLNRSGHRCVSLHGDKSQDARTAAFEQFKSGKTKILVATDVAARGVDIEDVEHVINVTFPLTIEDYVHRIGRTGRAGKTGESHTFFTDEDKAHAGALVNVLNRAKQEVPKEMYRFSLTTKKKVDPLYGAFGPKKDLIGKKATHIKFD